jgi:transposase InsO family protein
MILLSDLLRYEEPEPRTIRLLWTDVHGNAFVIDVYDPIALPVATTTAQLEADLREKRAFLVKPDPFNVIALDKSLSPSSVSRRDQAWAAIGPIVAKQPDIFLPRKRAALVGPIEGAGTATRVTVYLYLRLYWQRGMTKNALLADYGNCGAPGKRRIATPGKKLGRPRRYGDLPGMTVTDAIRQVFQLAFDRFYATSLKYSKQAVYDLMIKDFFCVREIDHETGLVIHRPKPESAKLGDPTYDQFLYWTDKDNLALVVRRQRMGPRAYDKDCRGLTGTSTAETWGPGSRYQIDATIADVFLVSRSDRNRIIGRPVLYVVIDVFSRMIVGIYVGLEGPSWIGAMMALSNTAEDKVAFCARYGRVISEDEWPCHHLPATLLGDGGEIESSLIEMLINNFNVTVETSAPYRADWKGIVERRFRLLPAVFRPYVPGYIETDYRTRGGTDYRYDAALDVDDFIRVIIECVLYFNNFHEISKYDKDRDVASDGVPPIPTDLWDWGIENRSGALRSFPVDLVRFSLMPVGQATVTEHGLQFEGSYYTSTKAMEELWFDRARQDGRWKIQVSYDSRDMDQIYIHEPKGKLAYHTGTLTERSRANRGLSLSEIQQREIAEKHAAANRRPEQQIAKSDMLGNIEQIVAIASQKTSEAVGKHDTRNVSDIRQHRAEEKLENRAQEAFRLGGASGKPSKTADIVKFPGLIEPSDEFSEPDITELLGQDSPDE